MKDETPQTGEGLHGERLSPLPNVAEDFPPPAQPIDLGEVQPRSMPGGSPLETQLPETVSHSEILADNLERNKQWVSEKGKTR